MKAVTSALAIMMALSFLIAPLQVVEAQSREEAIETFNEGFRLFSDEADYLAAIEKFKETIEIAEQVGAEANDIRDRAIGQIPRLAFMEAAQLVRNNQFQEAIDAFQYAIELAEEYDNEEVIARSRSNLPRLYLNIGNQYYRDEMNEEAYEKYQMAIEYDPSYVSAYYQMGLVYRRFGDLDSSLDAFDTAIELAREAGEADQVERAERAARSYLVYRASRQIEEENYSSALDFLNRAAAYGESASLHYRFAEVYNINGNHQDALASAQRALELEDGSASDMARIYFEIGLAYKGLENEADACSAFRNALHGDFRDPAEYELEYELNCN